MIVAAIMIIGVLGMLIGAIKAIYAGIPTQDMLESSEYTRVRKKGYKVRKRQLQVRFSVSLTLLIGCILGSVRSISKVVYSLTDGQGKDSWWIVIALLTVSGAVVALVVWISTIRRQKVLKEVRGYAE
jgi:hypothetical protein